MLYLTLQIGPHTFQLHEIYGLTSSAHGQATATTVTPDSHTYPPQATGGGIIDEDDPSSECLLCLSSPREVVLIPCRHLVACKECALNMVEFGAGGQITHATEPAVPPPVVVAESGAIETSNGAATADAAGTVTTPVGSPTTPATAPVTPTVPPTTTTRRKRKAKGWFCPVCRQRKCHISSHLWSREYKASETHIILLSPLYLAYTSLLRISTAAPPPLEKDERNSMEDGDPQNQRGQSQGVAAGTTSGDQNNDQNDNETAERPGGLLGGAFARPGFLRGFSTLTRGSSGTGTTGGNEQPPVATDVESRAGLGRVGA